MDEVFEAYREDLEEIEAHIRRNLDSEAPLINEIAAQILNGGGKRIRPILLLAATESVGGERRVALPFACAVEMIHTYSLIHDDLPAMDDDSLRRGKPTNHVVFGEAVAILAGDALLTEAFRVLADSAGNGLTARRAMRRSPPTASVAASRRIGRMRFPAPSRL